MPDIIKDVSLESLNTMAIPASANHYVALTDVSQFELARDYAAEHKLKSFVLGEGSNTIFASDYTGLIIHNRLLGVSKLGEEKDSVLIRAAAGEQWHSFVEHCLSLGCFGLENLGLIPGTVGAAPIQNIGAYGVEVESFIEAVHTLDIRSGKPRVFNRAECEFGYRESVFKRKLRDQYLLTAVDFRLSRIPNTTLHYPALAQAVDANATPQQVFAAVCGIRSAKLPNPIEIPNSGSFFKNPVVDETQFKKLKSQFPDIVSFVTSDGYKLAAAWLIDRAGWKSQSIEGVSVHQHQALVVINPKHQPGASVLKFAYSIQRDIEQKFGVSLEIEPRIVC